MVQPSLVLHPTPLISLRCAHLVRCAPSNCSKRDWLFLARAKMLSSSSGLVTWTKAGRDVERLVKCRMAPNRPPMSPIRTRTQHEKMLGTAKVLYKTPKASAVTQISGESMQSCLTLVRLKEGPRSLENRRGVRSFHVTRQIEKKKEKKKETNVKALASQGKRSKEKQDVDAKLKLTPAPAPEAVAKDGVIATEEERRAAQEAKEAQAEADPNGLLVDTRKGLHPSTGENIGSHAQLMKNVLEKMKETYPATYHYMRHLMMRTPLSQRRDMLTRTADWNAVYNDPDMKPIKEWFERLEGRGSPENALRLTLRRAAVAERKKMAGLWQELDAHQAELTAEKDFIELITKPKEDWIDEEAEKEIAEDPELAPLKEASLLDDPEFQVAANYLFWPRESIDPTGSLEAALSPITPPPSNFLNISDQVVAFNKFILDWQFGAESPSLPDLLGLDPDILKASELDETGTPTSSELSAMVEKAKVTVESAEKQGLFSMPNYQKVVEEWEREFPDIPVSQRNPLLLAHLVSRAIHQLNKTKSFNPEFDRLVEQLGPKHALAQIENREDALHEKRQMEHTTRILRKDTEILHVQQEVEKMIDSADYDDLEIAMHPEYAETVARELPDMPSLIRPSDPKLEAAAAEEHKRDIESFMEDRPIDPEFASEEDRLFDANPEEYMKKTLGGSKTVREESRDILLTQLRTAAQNAGEDVDDPAAVANLMVLADQIRLSPEYQALSEEDGEAVEEALGVVEQEEAQLLEEHLPVGNPIEQHQDLVQTLKIAKDALMDYNSELISAEARLDTMFERARIATAKMLDSPNKPEFISTLQHWHSTVHGDSLPNPIQGVTTDDMMAQWSQHMKEQILMFETRTPAQRESQTLSRLYQQQMEPLTTLDAPLSEEQLDSGIYEFTAADLQTERPVEERIYASPEDDVDSIFSPSNVGKFLSLTDKDMKRYLPEGVSSRLSKQEFKSTGSPSMLIRSQTLEAIANLKAQLNNAFVVPKSSSAHNGTSSDSVAKPMLLHGYKGCGKSAVLSQVVYWARRSGWLVISIPDGAKWLADGIYLSKNTTEGTWDQPKVFVRWFLHLLDAHHDKLKQIPLKTQGIKIGKITPKTLYDVVEYGSVLEQHASQCFAIFKSEIRRVVEFPVLMAFDSYNTLYNPSVAWKDPESTSYYKDPINPYNLSLGRLFYNAHLNHGLAYGTFIGAVSESEPIRRFVNYKPASTKGLSHVTPHYLEVPPYTMQEFTTVMEHYKHKNYVRSKMSPGSSSEMYIYQITSGFGEAIWTYNQKL